jgi:AcrR family transcriptional regulator
MVSRSHGHRHRHRHRSSSPESRAERKQRTREALLDGALRLLEDRAFGSLSLREVTREAGIVPAGFYRHFEDMDDLGLALVDDSFRRLRELLRRARENQGDPKDLIRSSLAVLVRNVHEHPLHFRFIARERNSGVPALRRAIGSEIRLFSSELATDLARYPHLQGWSSQDLRMLAALMVGTMVATVEALLDVPGADPLAEQEIITTAEAQLRLIVLAIPHWRSDAGAQPAPPATDDPRPNKERAKAPPRRSRAAR